MCPQLCIYGSPVAVEKLRQTGAASTYWEDVVPGPPTAHRSMPSGKGVQAGRQKVQKGEDSKAGAFPDSRQEKSGIDDQEKKNTEPGGLK